MISPEEYRKKYEADDETRLDTKDVWIQELQAENRKLRDALEIIADDKSLSFVVQQIAKKALSNEKT